MVRTVCLKTICTSLLLCRLCDIPEVEQCITSPCWPYWCLCAHYFLRFSLARENPGSMQTQQCASTTEVSIVLCSWMLSCWPKSTTCLLIWQFLAFARQALCLAICCIRHMSCACVLSYWWPCCWSLTSFKEKPWSLRQYIFTQALITAFDHALCFLQQASRSSSMATILMLAAMLLGAAVANARQVSHISAAGPIDGVA